MGRKKSPTSFRSVANMADTSHTTMRKYHQISNAAEEMGNYDEVQRRIMSGERSGKVLADLLPDLYAADMTKQAVNQYRSTVKKLLKLGFDADDLKAFVDETDQELKDSFAR